LRYGVIFWGGDPENISAFKLQKRGIWLISNAGKYTSCRELSKALNILPMPFLYISETVCYIKLNIDKLEKKIQNSITIIHIKIQISIFNSM
jgi:hypothetical protein